MPDWLWQGVVASFVYEMLAFLLVGIGMAYLKKRYPQLASLAMWGLGASALVALIVFCIRENVAMSETPKPPQPITLENADENVRSWLVELGYPVQKIPPNPNMAFGYQIKTDSQVNITVSRLLSDPRYLAFHEELMSGPEQQKLMAKIPDATMEQTIHECILELARSKVEFGIKGRKPDLAFFITRKIPITASMTDYSIFEAISDVEHSSLAVNEAFYINSHLKY
jgi:hypothetical protein